MFGALWRFALLMVLLMALTTIARYFLLEAKAHPFVSFWVLAAIWLTPMYLANRARQQAGSEE